jgi:dTDP-4-dehydrorhamnose 3,5-epimerase-like enzyme
LSTDGDNRGFFLTTFRKKERPATKQIYVFLQARRRNAKRRKVSTQEDKENVCSNINVYENTGDVVDAVSASRIGSEREHFGFQCVSVSRGSCSPVV